MPKSKTFVSQLARYCQLFGAKNEFLVATSYLPKLQSDDQLRSPYHPDEKHLLSVQPHHDRGCN